MGFTCRPIDHFNKTTEKSFREIVDIYVSNETRVVGLSSTLLSTFNTDKDPNEKIDYFGIPDDDLRSRISYIRQKAPKAMVVVGGPQTSLEFTSKLKEYLDVFDFFVSGQGEGPIRAIVNLMFRGQSMKTRYVDGVPFILADDHKYNDFQNSQIVWLPEDHVRENEALILEVARGCVFKCSYCTYDLIGKEWGDLMKNPDVLRSELIYNYETHGTTTYMIPDDTLNDSIEKVRLLHKVFTSLPFQIQFVCYIRLDLIWKHPEMIFLLYDMGIQGCNLGLETLHGKAGRLIGKGMGEERTKETLNMMRDVWGDDVVIKGNFITGLPYEPEESIMKTFEWAASEDCPLHRIDIFPLRVNGDHRISRMEKEQVEKHQYSFSPSDPTDWYRGVDGMSYQRAIELQKLGYKMLYENKPYTKVISSFALPAYTNVGVSFDDVGSIIKNKSTNIRGKEVSDIISGEGRNEVERYLVALCEDVRTPQIL